VDAADDRANFAIRIEVVVDVDAVDVVSLHDVEHRRENVRTCLSESLGSIHVFGTVLSNPVGMRPCDMRRRGPFPANSGNIARKRIEPGMQLESASMRLSDGVRQTDPTAATVLDRTFR